MAKKSFVEQIADIEKDFPQWYTDVVIKTKLVDYGPVEVRDKIATTWNTYCLLSFQTWGGLPRVR